MDKAPLRTLFDGAYNFLSGDYLRGELGRGRYHGNLVLIGDPNVIERETTEMYPDILENFLQKYGRNGYDDEERFHCLLTEMGVFDRNECDRDCAIALTPYYELIGTGRYVEGVDTRNLKSSDAMRDAERIKGDHINGRHLAGLHFSAREPGSASLVMSENGNTIITFRDGNLDSDLSTDMNGYQK